MMISCNNIDKKNFEWNHEDGYYWAKIIHEKNKQVGFKKLSSSQTNITFQNKLTAQEILNNRHYLNGSGVAVGDINGDGWVDIYFARLNGSNKLYKNQKGLKFVDITDYAGVAHKGYYSTGVVFADIDGDKDLDLIVSSMEKKNVIYLNDGSGKFTPQSVKGFSKSKGSHTMTLADIDGDSDIDLYLTNYKQKTVMDLFDLKDLSSQNIVKETFNPNADRRYTLLPPYDEHFKFFYFEDQPPDPREIGRKDELFLNNGDGFFEKLANTKQHFLDSKGNPQGLKPDWGLTSKFHDINQDGYPDLYVTNDFWTKDRIWMNQGEGVFREIAPEAIRNMSFSAMGIDFSDINRDGFWDIFVTEMLSTNHERRLSQFISEDPTPQEIGKYDNQPQYNRNSLYLNRGNNTFAEISYFSGLEASEWSWTTKFMDVDLDGYEDILVTTGFSFDFQDLDAQKKWREDMIKRKGKDDNILIFPSLVLPNKTFKNNGDLTFTDQSKKWGFTEEDISHGMAHGDFDKDGDLDIVVNRLNKEGVIYENKVSASRIAVRLRGKSPNTQAIGAKVELKGGSVVQQKEISAGGDYLSHSDPLVVFAANKENPNHEIIITWPDKKRSIINNVKAGRIYIIDEELILKKSQLVKEETEKKIFKDVSKKINHKHHERPYNDFIVQPLLPIKLSRQGPGISWIDFDSDGYEDLFISSGRDSHLAVYKNRGNANFQSVSLGKLTRRTLTDQTVVLGWREEQKTQILVGNANYETADINIPSVINLTYQNGYITEKKNIPGVLSTTGVIAVADYDGDADLDLFVGGRFIPTHYPMNATSRLFEKENDRYLLVEEGRMGLVTGTVFSDYDQDGDQDLVVSTEWGVVKLFENRNSNFVDITRYVGLNKYKGWWNGVATGDFNSDGLPDIIATNLGLNSPYQFSTKQPLKMYYQKINDDNKVDIIESYYNKSLKGYVPRRQLHEYESISGMFADSIKNNKAFASTTLDHILDYNRFNQLLSKEINTLKHMIFINEGNSFSAHPLPDKAQFSAAFYAGIADFDNDGNEDIFLTQNFFQFRSTFPRLDAGRGLWLKGDGNGNFAAVPSHISGIKVYGEQRGAALADFNDDHKVDLAISQNGAETKLYQNRTKRAGLSIRLLGPSKNRDGIGSSIRIVYEDGTFGPRREIQVGSGYLSQNSTTQILGTNINKKPKEIKVIWYDGTIQHLRIKNDNGFYKIVYPESDN